MAEISDCWPKKQTKTRQRWRSQDPNPRRDGREGGRGKEERKRDPTNRWLWPLSRNDLKIQDWEQELNFLSAFMCQVSWAPSTLLPLSLPSPAAAFSRLSRCAARQLAMPTMTSRTTLGPFALLYYTRIIFKSQLGYAPATPSFHPPLACTAERGWKNNFENLFSLILIRCKSFAFPLCAICVSDMDIAQRGWKRGGRGVHEAQGVWQIITFSDLASSSLFNYLPSLVANFHLEQQPGEHN